MRIPALIVASVLFATQLAACSPEAGSDAWCKNMKEKPKADWTTNEAKEYARSCIFKSND